MSTSSISSTQLFQDFLGKFHSRKLLLQNHGLNHQPVTATPPPYPIDKSFDPNVVMVFSFLLCALVCSLGINSLIRWALQRCSRYVASESHANSLKPIVKSGIEKKALKTFPVVNYSSELKIPGLDTECVICLSEFASGQRVRFLPKCNHGFHVRCIDKWLRSYCSCPKCRHCLIDTCHKIVGCSQSSSSGTSVLVPETVVSIRPLESEGIIHNYGGIS